MRAVEERGWPSLSTPSRVRTRLPVLAVIAVLVLAQGVAARAAVGDPDVVVTSPTRQQRIPAAGSLTITGTATDDVSVSRVSIALRRTDTGRYLSSAGIWVSTYTLLPATLTSPGAASTTWSYTWSAPVTGSYSVIPQAWDNGNRVDPSRSWTAFSVVSSDTTAPTLSIQVPASNQTFTAGPVTFSGSAGDNVGVTAVDVRVPESMAGVASREAVG
ncbi:MAG: hypothetical protein DYH08_04470 [Actinobacteria bacterium ATB1]|nr:hypothetical protein [Actinobacteria bacterium ATB1]